MGHIDGPTVHQDVAGADHEPAQELVKFRRAHLVVFDLSGPGAVVDVVGRVCPDHVRMLTSHERGHVRRLGGVTTHEPMHAQLPDLAYLTDRRLPEFRYAIRVFLSGGHRIQKDGVQLLVIEAGHAEICQSKAKLGHLDAQGLIIPVSPRGATIDEQAERPDLRRRQVISDHNRDLLHPKLHRRQVAELAIYDLTGSTHQNGNAEPPLLKGSNHLRQCLLVLLQLACVRGKTLCRPGLNFHIPS